MSDANDTPHIYVVRLTEPAEAEIELEHGRLAEIVSAEYADRWQDALLIELSRLAIFPTSHPVAPENDLYDVEVRRMLYYCPSGRQGRNRLAYRILFHVIPPNEDDPQGLVRVLHIWHSGRRPIV